jgi:hypothetical protein
VIVARLTGGLGNQMFQYAAAAALRERLGGSVKFDLGWFEFTGKEAFRLHAFQLDAEIATQRDLSLVDDGEWHGMRMWIRQRFRSSVHALGLLREPAFIRGVDEQNTLDPDLRTLRRGSYRLSGTWQRPDLFADIRQKLQREFRLKLPLSARAENWRRRIASEPTIAVHVRRGDAFRGQYANAIQALGPHYYAAAVKVARAKKPDAKFLVFSDEPDWVYENMPDLNEFQFMDDLSLEPHEVLELMKSCGHLIVANSTLSWWAAWLTEANESLVISPTRWFRSEAGSWRNLSLSSWVQIA